MRRMFSRHLGAAAPIMVKNFSSLIGLPPGLPETPFLKPPLPVGFVIAIGLVNKLDFKMRYIASHIGYITRFFHVSKV